jgi:hypothetical protein
MTADDRQRQPPLKGLDGVEKQYYDEFSGAEFQREASLFIGSGVRDIAHRRLRMLEELGMRRVKGGMNWSDSINKGVPGFLIFNAAPKTQLRPLSVVPPGRTRPAGRRS